MTIERSSSAADRSSSLTEIVTVRREKTGQEHLQYLLRDIGGNWTKSKPKPKVLTAEEKEIKLHLENATNWWKDWLFQMGWYALEWVEPMSCGENPTYYLRS